VYPRDELHRHRVSSFRVSGMRSPHDGEYVLTTLSVSVWPWRLRSVFRRFKVFSVEAYSVCGCV